jgi:hypothetical protein
VIRGVRVTRSLVLYVEVADQNLANNPTRLNIYIYIYMIDSDRRPLLKSVSTDVIISNHGPIL